MAEPRTRRGATPIDDRGLALLTVLLCLALLMAVVASSVAISVRESRVAFATSAAAPGLYAAEAGLALARAAWDTGRVAGVPPGQAVRMRRGVLASGDRYEARTTRLNPLDEEAAAYHLLESASAVRTPRGGSRRAAWLLRAPEPARWCCNAAVTSPGGVEVSGGATIAGSDPGSPREWDCSAEVQGDRAGALIGEAGRIDIAPGASLEGRPPYIVHGPGLELLLEEARAAFFEWIRRPEIVLLDGARLDRLGPALDGAGNCDRDAPGNWGEPLDSVHPCAAYLPIIHARGDLNLDGDGRGQGVLLVEGDLWVRGDVQFAGLILVEGELGWHGGQARGAILQLQDEEARIRVGEDGVLSYSGCAVQRALGSAKLVSPHPLAQFSWLEILEEG